MAEDGLRVLAGGLATAGAGRGVTLVGGAAGDAVAATGRWLAPATGDLVENFMYRTGGLSYAVKPGAGATAGVADVAAATRFVTTESVAVSGSRAIDLGASYEAGVRSLYGNIEKMTYQAVVNGKVVTGIADGVTSMGGRLTAVEAKFVESWSSSLRNPASPIGNTPWAIAEQQAMVDQAAKYSASFLGGVVYHTNSMELATYYSQLFKNTGTTNFRFVITPVK